MNDTTLISRTPPRPIYRVLGRVIYDGVCLEAGDLFQPRDADIQALIHCGAITLVEPPEPVEPADQAPGPEPLAPAESPLAVTPPAVEPAAASSFGEAQPAAPADAAAAAPRSASSASSKRR